MSISNNTSPEANAQNIHQAFINLLNTQGLELMSYIQGKLRQHRLYYVDALEILDEIFLRLVKYVSTGKQIQRMKNICNTTKTR